MEFIKKNLLVIFSIGLAVFILISMIIINIQKENETKPSASPSASPAKLPEQGKKYQVITRKDQADIDKDAVVGKLLEKLPYKGTNFSLEYNFSNYQFTLVLKNKDRGNKEFDDFLKQNNIPNKDWLRNLVIQEK